MSGPSVSAVIVSWNSLDYLPECLRSLELQELPPAETIVVDNGSTDGSTDWIRRHRPDVRLIESPLNEGFSAGNNRGIAVSSGEHVLLLNTDVTLDPGFIRRLADVLERDPEVGWTSGKLLRAGREGDDGDAGEPATAAGSGAVIDSAGEVFYRTRRAVNRGEGEVDRGQYDREEEVFGVTAAAALYRRSMLEDVRIGDEYLDEDFFAYLEDSDLNWRARLRGWCCVYVPRAVAWHVRQHATSRDTAIRRHAFANRYLSLIKNETAWNLVLALPHLVAYDTFRSLRALLREPALLAGLGKVVRLLPRTLRKRRAIQRGRRVSSRSLRRWMAPERYGEELRRRLRRRGSGGPDQRSDRATSERARVAAG